MPPRRDLDQEHDVAHPARFWGAVWIVFSIFTLYGATDLQQLILSSRWFDDDPRAIRASSSLVALSERAGVPKLKEMLEAPFHRNGPEAPLLPIAREARSVPHGNAPEPPEADSGQSDLPNADRRPVRRILLLGASSIQFHLGIELEKVLTSSYQAVTVLRYGKLGTSLSRPDALNWPEVASSLIDEFQPDLVVANFGGNDAQSMMVGKTPLSFQTAAWDREYALRVKSIIDAAHSRGSEIALIGMPMMRQANYSRRIEHINAIVEEVATRERALYIPTWDLTTDEHGGYQASVSFEGKSGPMRLRDGHHYSRLGAAFVAHGLARRLEQRFALVPREPRLTHHPDSGSDPSHDSK